MIMINRAVMLKESSFDELTINAVWNKARYVSTEHENRGLRKDLCGAWILRSAYGDRDNNYGWEIDHIVPTSKGGSDSLVNLQPLHWQNNAAKGDGPLVCAVSAQSYRS